MTTRIYLVEDHLLMQEMLSETMEKMLGLSVCGVAGSAEEALAWFADGEDKVMPDLVLIDMALPRMSGAELVAVLQERRPELRCIILSGHKEARYVEQALSAGARGYVLKGSPYELQGALQQVLGGEVYLSEPLRAA